MSNPIHAHDRDPNAANLVPASYNARGVCDRCGSMTVEKAIELLQTPGTRFSGSDWTPGWPHKFYIGGGKFYNIHLKDADDATLAQFAALSRVVFGIDWTRDDKGIRFTCPKSTGFHGFQRFGEIDSDGTPHHEDGYDSIQPCVIPLVAIERILAGPDVPVVPPAVEVTA